jgi:hypothetical protein
MAKGILYVESRPASPESAEKFHTWYDEIHIPEMLAIKGVCSARRFAPLDGQEGPFVAIYELEADDLSLVGQWMAEASRAGGKGSPPDGVLTASPVVRFMRDITAPLA